MRRIPEAAESAMAVSEAMKAFPKAMVSFAEAIRGAGQALGSVPCGPREPAPSGPVPESVRITSSGARVPAPVVRACPPPRKPAAEPPAAVPPHAPPAPAGAGRGAALLARPMFRTAARILFPARPLARPGDRSAQAARTQILAPVPGPVRLPFGLPRVSLAPAALALALSALFAAFAAAPLAAGPNVLNLNELSALGISQETIRDLVSESLAPRARPPLEADFVLLMSRYGGDPLVRAYLDLDMETRHAPVAPLGERTVRGMIGRRDSKEEIIGRIGLARSEYRSYSGRKADVPVRLEHAPSAGNPAESASRAGAGRRAAGFEAPAAAAAPSASASAGSRSGSRSGSGAYGASRPSGASFSSGEASHRGNHPSPAAGHRRGPGGAADSASAGPERQPRRGSGDGPALQTRRGSGDGPDLQPRRGRMDGPDLQPRRGRVDGPDFQPRRGRVDGPQSSPGARMEPPSPQAGHRGDGTHRGWRGPDGPGGVSAGPMPEGGADDYADRGFRSRGGHSRGRDGGYPFRGGEDGEGPADGQYQDYPEDDSQYPQQASGPQGIPSYSPAPAQDDEVFMGTFQKITPDGHRVLVHRNANADGPGMVTEIGPDGRKYRRVMSSSPAD